METIIGYAVLTYFGIGLGLTLFRPLIERFYRWQDRKAVENTPIGRVLSRLYRERIKSHR